jgi:hypothetical protein
MANKELYMNDQKEDDQVSKPEGTGMRKIYTVAYMPADSRTLRNYIFADDMKRGLDVETSEWLANRAFTKVETCEGNEGLAKLLIENPELDIRSISVQEHLPTVVEEVMACYEATGKLSTDHQKIEDKSFRYNKQ